MPAPQRIVARTPVRRSALPGEWLGSCGVRPLRRAWISVDALATWLASNRVAASIFRNIIPDRRRSLCEYDHVHALLLYRVYHVADVLFRIGTTVVSMCSHFAVRPLQSRCGMDLPNIPGADVCPLRVTSRLDRIASARVYRLKKKTMR